MSSRTTRRRRAAGGANKTAGKAANLYETLSTRIEMFNHGLPEETIRRMIDYVRAAGDLTNGKHDFRIPYVVADEWSRDGHAVLSTNRLAEQFGSTRRTICLALERLIEAGAIERIGTAPSGAGKYVPCLEVGDAWRAEREAQNGR